MPAACGKDDCDFCSCEMQTRLGWERGYFYGGLTIEKIGKELVYYMYDDTDGKYTIDRATAHRYWHNVIPKKLPKFSDTPNWGTAFNPNRRRP